MATIKDASAMSALNEQDYINKLYDSNDNSQKKLLQENYTENVGALDQQQKDTQAQTQEHVNRTNVEAAQGANLYGAAKAPKVSAGANAQAALMQGNAVQKNTTALKNQQNQAEAEIQRQRDLAGSLYASEIKKAQADNNMERAQALYDAAKAEDEQYLALRKQAATLMAGKGDNSILDSLAGGGETAAPADPGETWAEVTKNEDAINAMYDAQLEGKNQELSVDYQERMSDLGARQEQARQETDRKLNQEYVDNLQKARNYAEVQTAYGQGSGTGAQERLTREAEHQSAMTELRRLQMGADAGYGVEGYDLGKAYREGMADAQKDVNAQRAKALYEAAEGEEQTLVENQKFVGSQYANQGDYEMLGKLYGLTPDQIDRLMGRGAYAPVYVPESKKGSPGKPTPETVIDMNDIWVRNDINQSGWANVYGR